MATSKDMVAGVLAQSISQIVLRNGIQSLIKARWTAAAVELGRFSADRANVPSSNDMSQEQLDALQKVVTTSIAEEDQNQQTLAADAMAVRLLLKVGYNPLDYLDLLMILANRSIRPPMGTNTATFLEQRIEAVRAEVAHYASVQKVDDGKKERQQRFESIHGRL